MIKNRKIKILIADDSFFMRKLLRQLVESTGDLEFVGEAKDGKEVVKLAKQLKPDVITMDYNMPILTGSMATKVIVSEMENPPAIIMLSAFTREGTEETLESLRAGAVDFICKPSGELSLDIDKVADELFRKIKMAANARVQSRPIAVFKEKKTAKLSKGIHIPRWLVVIGASTGGPPVLEEILTHINANIIAAFLIVQHMPAHFTKSFAERLDKMSDLIVREAADGDLVEEGKVLIAPGDYHMTLKDNDGSFVVKLNQDPPLEGLRPSIDILFSSVSRVWDGRMIAVECTGMGKDGSHTMKDLKENGAIIIVQSPETSVVDSMPESIINQGLANEVLTPLKIAQKINELVLK